MDMDKKKQKIVRLERKKDRKIRRLAYMTRSGRAAQKEEEAKLRELYRSLPSFEIREAFDYWPVGDLDKEIEKLKEDNRDLRKRIFIIDGVSIATTMVVFGLLFGGLAFFFS